MNPNWGFTQMLSHAICHLDPNNAPLQIPSSDLQTFLSWSTEQLSPFLWFQQLTILGLNIRQRLEVFYMFYGQMLDLCLKSRPIHFQSIVSTVAVTDLSRQPRHWGALGCPGMPWPSMNHSLATGVWEGDCTRTLAQWHNGTIPATPEAFFMEVSHIHDYVYIYIYTLYKYIYIYMYICIYIYIYIICIIMYVYIYIYIYILYLSYIICV